METTTLTHNQLAKFATSCAVIALTAAKIPLSRNLVAKMKNNLLKDLDQGIAFKEELFDQILEELKD